MRTFLFLWVMGLGVGLSSNTFALKTEGEPTIEDYRLCIELVHNAHAISSHPQDKMVALIYAGALLDKWMKLSGASLSEARAEADKIGQKSIKEFKNKENFFAIYSQEEYDYYLKLVAEIEATIE